MTLKLLTRWDVEGLTLSGVFPKKVAPYTFQKDSISRAETHVNRLVNREAPKDATKYHIYSWTTSNFLETTYSGAIAFY